jgi:predicted ester cyclase
MVQARDVAERFYELFAAGKIDDCRDLFDASCITLMPTGPLDQDQHAAVGHTFRAAFPDSHMEIDRWVGSGDEVVALGYFKGTHDGDLVSPGGTIPASGNPLNLRFIDYWKSADGKIVDHQIVFDQMELLGQLGALPG